MKCMILLRLCYDSIDDGRDRYCSTVCEIAALCLRFVDTVAKADI